MTTDAEVLQLFTRWNNAIVSGNVDDVVACYAKHAILLPTFSDKLRQSHEEIREYFTGFIAKKPNCHLVSSTIRIFDHLLLHSGLYNSSFLTNIPTVNARYTFVYERINSDWLIITHHSSVLPKH